MQREQAIEHYSLEQNGWCCVNSYKRKEGRREELIHQDYSYCDSEARRKQPVLPSQPHCQAVRHFLIAHPQARQKGGGGNGIFQIHRPISAPELFVYNHFRQFVSSQITFQHLCAWPFILPFTFVSYLNTENMSFQSSVFSTSLPKRHLGCC